MSQASSLSPAVEPPARRRLIGGFLAVFAAAFIFAGWFGFSELTVKPCQMHREAAQWIETRCVIERIEYVRERTSDGYDHRVDARYRYIFEGRPYAGDRFALKPLAGDKEERQRFRDYVAAQPAGTRTVCFVNPDNPREAVLNREMPSEWWAGLAALVFLLVGVGISGLAWRVWTRGEAEGMPMPHVYPSRTPVSAEVPGEIELKPSVSRGCAFFGTLFVAVLWNLPLGLGATDLLSWHLSWGSLVFLLFMVPFWLVGLALVYGTWVQFRMLFVPPPVLRIVPSKLRLGARVPLSWRLGSEASELLIRLIAREEAEHGLGSDKRTEKSEFLRVEIVRSTDRRRTAAGLAQIPIPEAALPAWDAPHNRVIWELVVQARIRGAPALDERFLVPMRGPESPASVVETPAPRARVGGGVTLWTVDRFAPGETLVFSLVCDADAPTRARRVQLGWCTEGRGTRDAQIVWSEPLRDLAPGTERRFEVTLPETPWSFTGKFVELRWRLEVLDAEGAVLAEDVLVVAPRGEWVVLAQLPEDEVDMDPAWLRRLQRRKRKPETS